MKSIQLLFLLITGFTTTLVMAFFLGTLGQDLSMTFIQQIILVLATLFGIIIIPMGIYGMVSGWKFDN